MNKEVATNSIWKGTSKDIKTFPVYEGNTETDVVVVGGGITGLTCAMLLSNGGKKVILLEGMQIGLGTTGNSTGNLYVTVDEHLSHIRKKWNDQVMKDVVASRKSAIDLIEQTINQYSIDCNFVRTSFNYFAEELNDDIGKFIKEEFDALTDCGLKPELNEQSDLPFPVKKNLAVPGQAQFHPLKYVRKLASVISDKCSIYENSAIIDFDEKKGTVTTDKGVITAKHIVMATHVPKGVFSIQAVLAPYREFGVAAEVKNSTLKAGIFWGLVNPKHSVRTYTEGEKKYVMVIGDKFKTGHNKPSQHYIDGLENYLKQRFDVGEFKYVWGGQQYRSGDGLPYIGKHSEHMYFLTGFATDGLVYGTLAAAIVSDEILGRQNQWAKMYRVDRHTPLKSAAQFIKESADNAVQYLKDIPWNTDVASINEIRPGEGKVMEISNEKVAVYKDEKGTAHMISAVCTHMKCIVNWNVSEKTWDCPCHGSRFKCSGEVIEGPALNNLEKKK